MIHAGENLKFLLKQTDLEANEFDKLMKWTKGTTSRYQTYEDKSPPMHECIQIITFFKIKLDDFILQNLKISDDFILSDSANEPQAIYQRNTEGVGELKIDLIESERQLYERVIRAKDEIIEILKQQLNNSKM